MVKSIEIEVRHQLGLYIINCLTKCFDKLVEILFIQKDLMPVIPVIIKPFPALRYSEVVIVAAGGSYIKKVSSSFTSANALAVNTLRFTSLCITISRLLFIILVRHFLSF